MLRLRYHHLNCIPGFEGKGYSPEFCGNMADIKKRIESGEEYELVLCADDICRACPNLQNGVCVNEAKVGKYDLKPRCSEAAILKRFALTVCGLISVK